MSDALIGSGGKKELKKKKKDRYSKSQYFLATSMHLYRI